MINLAQEIKNHDLRLASEVLDLALESFGMETFDKKASNDATKAANKMMACLKKLEKLPKNKTVDIEKLQNEIEENRTILMAIKHRLLSQSEIDE